MIFFTNVRSGLSTTGSLSSLTHPNEALSSTIIEIENSPFQNEANITFGILDDPFDAEWAALAMRDTPKLTQANSFLNDKNEPEIKKAFQLS